jgi:hypothetical protein
LAIERGHSLIIFLIDQRFFYVFCFAVAKFLFSEFDNQVMLFFNKLYLKMKSQVEPQDH